ARAARPICASSAGCVHAQSILADKSDVSVGVKSRPVLPSRMISASAPSREPITGSPQAKASTIVKGKHSYQLLGKIKKCASLIRVVTAAGETQAKYSIFLEPWAAML